MTMSVHRTSAVDGGLVAAGEPVLVRATLEMVNSVV